MLSKTPSGKYVVKSADGSKRLSKPMSKARAERRLAQVEYFANRDAKRRVNRRA